MKLLSINYAFNSGLGFMGNRKKEDIIFPLQDPTICLESTTTGSHNAYSRLWKVPACFMFVHMFQGSLECLITNHPKTAKRYNIHITVWAPPSLPFLFLFSSLEADYHLNIKNVSFLSMLCFKPIYFNAEESRNSAERLELGIGKL